MRPILTAEPPRVRTGHHREAKALLAQHFEIGGKPGNGRLGKGREFAFALIPPIRQRALRIDIDQHDGSTARALRLDGQMPGQCGFSRTTLLRSHRENAHYFPGLICSSRESAM